MHQKQSYIEITSQKGGENDKEAQMTGNKSQRLPMSSRLSSVYRQAPTLFLLALITCLLLLSALVADPAPVRAAEISEADGTKIEQFSVRWLTPDTVDDGNAARLSLVPTDNGNQSVRIALTAALSGQDDYAPGTVRITIPKSIFTYRDGKVAGTMSLSVPKEPSTAGEFSYREEGDSYVITNVQRLSSASQVNQEFTIGGISPFLMNGNPDAYQSAPFQGTLEVTTSKGTKLTKTSNAIDATIDTSEKITSAVLYADSDGKIGRAHV